MKNGDRVEFQHGHLRGQRGTVVEAMPDQEAGPLVVQRDTWEDTNASGKVACLSGEVKQIDVIERLGEIE